MIIAIKILSYKAQLRYSVRRVVNSACEVIRMEYPHVEINITEICRPEEILAYTQVLVAPALVINEKLVYDCWIPTRAQVVDWLRLAVQQLA